DVYKRQFHGSVKIAHGTLPLPAPATIELLKGAPWRELGIEGEIVTPTGAAILAELAESYGPMPAMKVETVGFGAGKKEFGIPNVLRVVIGDPIPSDQKAHSLFPSGREQCDLSPSGPQGARLFFFLSGAGEEDVQSECDEVTVIETNIDDISPQVYDFLMDRLLAAGALDVYLTPIQMKKNRPAVLVSVMCAPENTTKMCEILFEETSTIGVRIDCRSRICLARELVVVETRFGSIRVKVARMGDEIVNAQPEYEDCKTAAVRYSVPVKLVRDTALAAFLNSQPD
ncbi:MAG: LarC family nickel insertion protein, partial [Armatimonadetes bacterium]|nr:LarC family nickel insertion protein [Armatimonadota bacterium]